MVESIKLIGEQFSIAGRISQIKPLTSGHINDTYLIVTTTHRKYVLQKINTQVFKNVKALIANKVLVSKFLQTTPSNYKVVTFIKALNDTYYVIDHLKNYWNLMTYIDGSVTHNIVTSSKLAYFSGKLYGDFIVQASGIETQQLTQILPDFHSIPIRYNQFDSALLQADSKKIAKAQHEIDFVIGSKSEMHELSYLKDNYSFPIRVTHNDTKLSNILFNEKEEGLAVIDLDTVMPGIVHFDFGDSVRSICSTATEDETDLNKVSLNIVYFEAFCKGFAESTKTSLTPLEIKYLPLGAKTITFIMGLRFLTDYLNNNRYYKINYDLHNLDRAKNQFKLVKDIQKKYDDLVRIVQTEFSNNIS